MICEVCHRNNAEIIFKTVTGNQVATKAMCMSCANSMQQDMIKMFMALGFKKEQVEESQPAPEPVGPSMPRYICTGCGRPFDKLDDQTMAGCSACYDMMREDLCRHVMPQDQKDQAPEQTDTENGLQPGSKETLKELRYHLMEAVIGERYEEAAALRDEIARNERDQA